MANPPAGWHPDPLARHAQRYWDGTQWTEHVADQSGNMATDPLDGGQAAQQTTQQDPSWGTAEASTASAGSAAAAGDTGSDTPSWGSGDTDTATDETTSWGDTETATDTGAAGDDASDASGDATPAWGTTTDTGDGASADETVPGWGEPVDESSSADAADAGHDDTSDADAVSATDEPAWGDGGGAAGAAAAAGAVAVSASDDAHEDGGTDAGTGDAGTADAGTADAGSAGSDHPSIATVDVGDGIVVRHGHVLASSGDVELGDSPHPGSQSATGTGTVWIGAGGRHITVVDVPAGGLTVRDDALVAHNDGLDRSAAADGIVGFDGTSVSGSGWVAIAASGGTLEVAPDVDVSVTSLVAYGSDLDVSHAEHVSLSGQGMVLISAGS